MIVPQSPEPTRLFLKDRGVPKGSHNPILGMGLRLSIYHQFTRGKCWGVPRKPVGWRVPYSCFFSSHSMKLWGQWYLFRTSRRGDCECCWFFCGAKQMFDCFVWLWLRLRPPIFLVTIEKTRAFPIQKWLTFKTLVWFHRRYSNRLSFGERERERESSEKKENIQTVKLYFLVLSFTVHTVIDTESFQNGWVVLAVCVLGHKKLDDNSAYRKFLIKSGTGQNGCAQSPVEEAVVEKENTRSTWMFYFVDSWYFSTTWIYHLKIISFGLGFTCFWNEFQFDYCFKWVETTSC